MRKKNSEEDEQTLAELHSAHRHLQAKYQFVQPITLKGLNCSYLRYIINNKQAYSVSMGDSCPRSFEQTLLRSVCTYDLGKDTPIQTPGSVN